LGAYAVFPTIEAWPPITVSEHLNHGPLLQHKLTHHDEFKGTDELNLPGTTASGAMTKWKRTACPIPTLRNDALRELKCRILALPLALLVARLVAGTGLRMAVGMLAMVMHESGHAIAAWLTGRWAVPLLWVTLHGEERSWWIVLALTAAIVFGGFQAWKRERWGWVVDPATDRPLFTGGSPDRFFRGWWRNGAGHNPDGDILRTARMPTV